MRVWFFYTVIVGAFGLGSGLVLWTFARLTKMRLGPLVFACLAAVGLILSAVVHFSTFAGADPIDIFPLVWLLHVGIFLVFIPALFASQEAQAGGQGSSACIFANAPKWMVGMAMLFFVYALVNFGVFMFLMREGQPTQRKDGTFAVTDHGELVRRISEDEFHHLQGLEARGFSGHWLLFYSWALTILVSTIRRSSAKGGAEIEDRHGVLRELPVRP
jgi:hypothetical protein